MKKISFLVLLVIPFFSFSQDLRLYEKKEFSYKEGIILPYRILYPENYDKTQKYPLVLFLHGAGERGNDNEKQLVHGSKLFLTDENRKNFPAIIVFPQCATDSTWGSTKLNRTVSSNKLNFDYSTPPTTQLISVMELLKKITKEESVKMSSIYIAGLSMGGMGTFEAVYRYPGIFAAAIPICGGGDSILYDKRVKKTAFWIFHGAADAVVDVKLSRQMNTKLQSLKVDVTYTEYPGVYHNSWDNAFNEPSFMIWMFSKKRKNVKFNKS